MKLRLTKMREVTFNDFKQWLEKEEIKYFATPHNDIILNFEDMRIEHIDGNEVRIYLDKDNRYKIFELAIDYDCTDIKIFWAQGITPKLPTKAKGD